MDAPIYEDMPEEDKPRAHGRIAAPREAVSKREDGKFEAGYAHQKKNGNPILTIQTLKDLLIREKVVCRYNVISKNLDLIIPEHAATSENFYASSFAWIASKLKSINMDLTMLDDFLLHIGEENRFNPVREWIESAPWDGEKRLKSLFDTIKAEDELAKEIFIFRWLVTCIAAACEPEGIASAGMLVLQGDQGIGKTFWFKTLFPGPMIAYFKDGIELDPRNKDSVKKVIRHWVSELGELDGTLNRTELAALKAFVTADKDVLRMPYQRREQELCRRTALCATVNNKFFLKDPTGNRRFWTVACKSINSYHKIDMQQVWAEVYELYKAGEKWSLNAYESGLLRDVNEDFEQLDFATDKVGYFYNWDAALESWKSPAQIAEEMGMKNPTRGDLISIGIAVSKRNGGLKRRFNAGFRLKMPPKSDLMTELLQESES